MQTGRDRLGRAALGSRLLAGACLIFPLVSPWVQPVGPQGGVWQPLAMTLTGLPVGGALAATLLLLARYFEVCQLEGAFSDAARSAMERAGRALMVGGVLLAAGRLLRAVLQGPAGWEKLGSWLPTILVASAIFLLLGQFLTLFAMTLRDGQLLREETEGFV